MEEILLILKEKFRDFPIEIVEKDEDFFMERENDEGHIEYKKTLMRASESKLRQYASQMMWRVGQNLDDNIAIYYIGVEDDGKIGFLTQDQVVDNLDCLTKLCNFALTSIVKIEVFTTKTRYLCLKATLKGTQLEFDCDFGDCD
jgi:GTPase